MGNSDLNTSLSVGVSLYRKLHNLTAEECAQELGISKTTLVKIEQQRANPTLDTVELIARNMGIDPRALLGEADTTNYLAALFLMNLIQGGDSFSLDTLQQAVDHLQGALNLLYKAQTGSAAPIQMFRHSPR